MRYLADPAVTSPESPRQGLSLQANPLSRAARESAARESAARESAARGNAARGNAVLLAGLLGVLAGLPTASAERIETLTCAKRTPCRVAKTTDAGRGKGGEALQVVEVALHERRGDWRGANPGGECAPWEVWLISTPATGADKTPTATKLMALCNDGYGASGVGEDAISVGPNRLSWSQHGGSAWRWTNGVQLQLSPLRPIHVTDENFHTGGGFEDESTFDITTFRGTRSWACGEKAEKRSVPLIPKVEIDSAWAETGWKTETPGTCSLRVDGSGAGGALVHGSAGSPTDATLRVVASGSTLFIEVVDDKIISGSKSWLYDDHIEIWAADRVIGAYGCMEETKPQQWGIRLTDGKVFPAYGKPRKAPVVAVHSAGGKHRMKVTFDKLPSAIAVVFSDSDDGTSQERLIGTAPVKLGKSETLGAIHQLNNTEAVCRVTGGALSPAAPTRGWEARSAP